MLSRFVLAFLPKSKCLLILWLQSPSVVILEPKKMKSHTISIVSPSICHEVMGPGAMILVFWMLSFKPPFSFSSFTLIFSSETSSPLKKDYVAVLDLSCDTLDLQLPHSVSFINSCGMQDLVPWPASNLGPLHWECGVSTTGPPGKPWDHFPFFSANKMWEGIQNGIQWQTQMTNEKAEKKRQPSINEHTPYLFGVSNCPIKGTGILGETDDTRAGSGKVQDYSGTFCGARK